MIKHHSLSLDIDNELENMNPLLLEFVNSMTATVRERKYPALKNENDTIAVYCGNQQRSYHGTSCTYKLYGLILCLWLTVMTDSIWYTFCI